jgi:hypothetical protein
MKKSLILCVEPLETPKRKWVRGQFREFEPTQTNLDPLVGDAAHGRVRKSNEASSRWVAQRYGGVNGEWRRRETCSAGQCTEFASGLEVCLLTTVRFESELITPLVLQLVHDVKI